MRDGTLAARHLAERVAIEAHRAAATTTDTPIDARTYAQTAAGRRALRGIPCVGTGGLDERRDPLLELLDRERDNELRDALATLHHPSVRPI